MTNPDKVICYIDRCQAMATRFVYSRDIDSATADIFLCQKHWEKGKRFFKLLVPSTGSDFRKEGFELSPGVIGWIADEEQS